MPQADADTKIQINRDIKEPCMYRVIYINDSLTSMQFVVDSLVDFFNYTTETAVKLTDDINTMGSATVAVLPYEIAEQKGIEVTIHARNQNYPLQVKLEPELI